MADPYEHMDAWEFFFRIVGNKLKEYGWSNTNPLLCDDVSVSNLGIQWSQFNATARLKDKQTLHDFEPTLNALMIFCKEKEEDLKETFEGKCFLKACGEIVTLAPKMREDLRKGFLPKESSDDLSDEELAEIRVLLEETTNKFLARRRKKSLWQRFLGLFK